MFSMKPLSSSWKKNSIEEMLTIHKRLHHLYIGFGNSDGYPKKNIYIQKDRVRIFLILPGMDPEKFELLLQENSLLIRGERTPEKKILKAKYVLSEILYGNFEKRITLPFTIEAESLEARYCSGILKITGKRSVSVKKRVIIKNENSV